MSTFLEYGEGWRDDSYAEGVSGAVKDGVEVMTDLIDRIREVLERHRIEDFTAQTGHSCDCGAKELSDHSRHVAQEIVASLGLRPERDVNVKDELRYVSAWFDDELTKLEGAE